LHQKRKWVAIVGVFGAIHACGAQSIHQKRKRKKKDGYRKKIMKKE
jgi:hypothetical protein